MKYTVYLGLGSNLSDRRAQLETAVALLGEAGVEVTRVSPVCETAPMYLTDQPMFLNQVVEGKTEVLPRTLIRHLQAIEHRMGRERTVANGPRLIDLDLLFYGDFIIESADLRLPHPRIAERRFVLEPLFGLAPELRHPETGRTVAQMLRGLDERP